MPAIELNLYRDTDSLRPADQASMIEMDRIPYGKRMICTIMERKRTNPQNRAIRLYCKLVACEMNDAGYQMELRIMKKRAFISATPENVLENIGRVIQVAMGLPSSTTKLSTAEVSQVYNEMARLLAETYGIDIPFPSVR